MSSILQFLLGSKSVGFLTLHEMDNAYLGSLLVTDFKSIPVEFRCTNLIKPDAIQKALHGKILASHIGVNLCGKPLIRSTKNRPRLILVNKPFLLNLNNHSSCPVIFIKELDDKEDSSFKEVWSECHIDIVGSNHNGQKPLKIVKNGELKPETKELIGQIHTNFNLMDPFKRMERAVESIIQKRAKFM